MKQAFRVGIEHCMIIGLLWLGSVSLAMAQPAERAAIDGAIEAVYPSLVRIAVVAVETRDGREVNVESYGSGTIISPDGFVVTNHHVAGRAQRIICTLADRREVAADLVGTDPLTDIAVLKLRPETPEAFPAARFGDSATLRRGDPVLAMGSPRALSQSVTLGVVSNTEMIMPLQQRLELEGEDVGQIVRWIGHDAAIFPGNSGGPLVNLAGEIVGINEIGVGLAGAIPGNLARSVAEAIMRDGRVQRSWSGFEIQPLVGRDAGSGALIAWVASGTPADTAGLQAGDVLVRVAGTPIDVRVAEQLPLANQILVNLAVGEPATFLIRRDAKETTVTLSPIERPPAASIAREIRGWGLAGSSPTPFEARLLGRSNTAGVRVVSLRQGGPANTGKPPLLHDDVILSVDNEPVHSPADIEAVTRAILGDGPRAPLLVEFERGLERRLSIVEVLGDPPAESPPAEARKAWLPVNVQVLTPPLAERLGLAGRTGVRVTQLIDNTLPLAVGDVILAVDGQPLRASQANEEENFAAVLRQYPLGASVDLTVSRAGMPMTIAVALGVSPTLTREMKRYEDPDFGFRVRDLSDTDRRDPRYGDTPGGVFVDRVELGSWASLARLASSDIVLAVDDVPVASVDELADHLQSIKAQNPASVVLLVQRGVKTLFVDIQPVWH